MDFFTAAADVGDAAYVLIAVIVVGVVGIASGTFSSIFTASMLLVMWEKGEYFFKYLGGGDHSDKNRTTQRRSIRERELAKAR